MRKLLLLVALFSLACQTTRTTDTMSKPPATTTPSTTPVATTSKLSVLPDLTERVSQLPRTPIDYDRSLLNDNERQVVAKLIEASKYIDEIYWRQVSEENPSLRTRLQRQSSASPADRAAYDYFVENKGRWDRLKENEPFIEPFGPAGAKPPGAAFYPADMTKEEFERFIAAHPDQKDALQGLFTVVRRQGNQLVAIRYSTYYRDLLEPAAQRIREAAAITDNGTLKTYLTRLADAFMKDDYRDSDMAWMDLAGPIEVVIGPYEVYEDELFNYKASFESFVTVVDRPESEKLAAYAHALPDMERNLPEPDQYRNPNRGSESPIRVVQEIYTAGDARRGVQTAAFNLPNDEFVREKKGIEEGPAQERHQREVQPERQADRAARARRVATAARELRRLLQPDSLPRAVARTRPRLHHAAGRIARRSAHPAQEPLLHHRRNEGRRPGPVEHRLRAQSQSAHGVRRASALRDVRGTDVPLDALRHRRGAWSRHRRCSGTGCARPAASCPRATGASASTSRSSAKA